MVSIVKKTLKYIQYKLNYSFNISMPQYIISALLPKRVQSGIFKGMYYLSQSTGSVILPKLIGSYESELWPVFSSIKGNDYDIFVDVGAAEGYYAVGLYKYIFNQRIKCIAFEATERGRRQLKKLAFLNGATDIVVNGFCNTATLSNALSRNKSFLLVDVEGGEFDLLDINKVPGLINSDILVEIHPEVLTSIKEVICARFEQTHVIYEYKINTEKLFPDQVKLRSYIDRYKQYMLNEFRGNQSWLFLQSKLERS